MKTLKTEIFADKKGCTQIRLLEPLSFEYNGVQYIIPRGFVSDGASVPRVLWRLLDPPITAATLIPSVKHDYTYRIKPKIMTRTEADKLYYDDLRSNGYNWFKCQTVYAGLRLFGNSSYQV